MICVNVLSFRPTRYLLSDTDRPASVDYTPNPVATSPALKVVQGTVGNARSERVLSYLASAEFKEIDPWARDDYRVAWLTVLRADEGHSDPWRYSFWMYYGLTPEKALERWALRDREREAMFASLSAPKKPVQSERRVSAGRKVA